MSEEEQKLVFEPFLKSENIKSRQMNRHGNGVGLSICRQICESLEGKISVFSRRDFGSRFTFSMRVYKANSDETMSNTLTDFEPSRRLDPKPRIESAVEDVQSSRLRRMAYQRIDTEIGH